MREILFRGQTRKKGEKVRMDGTPVESNWVYGGIFQGQNHSVIYGYDPVEKHVVYSETIGQYTGLKDKNGKKIFEGDIVRYIYEPGKGFWNANQLSVIECKGTGYHMKGIFGTNKYACMSGWLISIPYDQESENKPEFEVIGNIHDNPELLEEE